MKKFAKATNYLKDHEIFTLEKLDAVLAEVRQRYGGIRVHLKQPQRDR